jgi:hypothetical protein
VKKFAEEPGRNAASAREAAATVARPTPRSSLSPFAETTAFVAVTSGLRDWRDCPEPTQPGGDMSHPLVYVDTSEVRDGALEKLKAAIRELVEFIDANEPQLIAYNVYLSDDGSEMTVVHVHADAASLEYHMEVAGLAFRQFAELITLSSIRVYGRPSEKTLSRLYEKARLLGSGSVIVYDVYAGFSRVEAP